MIYNSNFFDFYSIFLFIMFLHLHFCQAQPKLQVKLSLKAKLALVLIHPAGRPASHLPGQNCNETAGNLNNGHYLNAI